MKKIFTIVAGLMLLCATNAFGQIGGLDTTFGQSGVVETYINDVSAGYASALQADGKIVVTGYTYDSTKNVFATARYNTDGSVDTTFGVEGVDTISFQNGNNNATALAIQSNGKIVVAGYSAKRISKGDSTVKSFLIRYTTAGTLDSTFGIKGIVTDSIGTDNRIYAIVIQPDGKIVATGGAIINGKADSLVVVRYDSTGVLDTSFNHTGITIANIGSTAVGNAMAIQPNGKIVVAGAADVGGSYSFALARYNTNGTLDTGFGTKGITTISRRYGLYAYAIALQHSGKIIIGGYINYNNSEYDFALARYDTAGILDMNFGASGFAITAIGANADEIKSLAIDTADKIIAGGITRNKTLAYDFAVARYDSSGIRLDTTFGDTGVTITGFGAASSYGQSVLIQPDGKVVLAGYALVGAKGLFAIARYNIAIDTATTDTIPNDTSTVVAKVAIETNSLFVYPNPSADDATLKYTLTTDETLTIAIYDITGKLIEPIITNENRTAGSYEEPLNLSALPAGIYILALSNTNSQSLIIKLIKE